MHHLYEDRQHSVQAGHCKRELLLLSDAASYMTACTATLKVFYLRLFHVTCLAHMLHNCAEKVRGAFADVDNLVARVKAVTIKNKSRQAQFKHIGSPLEPVVTRWGTWLKVADYYANNLIEVKKIVSEFEGDEILVKRAKEEVNDAGITASLLKIKWVYSQLPKIIQKIESPKFSIAKAHTAISGKFYYSIRSILTSHFRSQLQSRQRRHCPIC